MPVSIQSDERLENRRCQLKDQCNHADLCEGETKRILQQRIQSGNDRLNHVVQQMAGAHREQDSIGGALRDAGMSLYFIPNGVYHTNLLFIPPKNAVQRYIISPKKTNGGRKRNGGKLSVLNGNPYLWRKLIHNSYLAYEQPH